MTREELNFIKDAFSQIIDDIAGNPDWGDAARAVASNLGTLERQLKEKVLHDYWKQASDQCAQARKEAKAEALKEFEEKYKQSWFNEGKIAGRFEGLTEDEKYQQGVHDGKEEALNDLPRWKKLPNGIMKQVNLFGRAIIVNNHYILYSDLEKLPGFKED